MTRVLHKLKLDVVLPVEMEIADIIELFEKSFDVWLSDTYNGAVVGVDLHAPVAGHGWRERYSVNRDLMLNSSLDKWQKILVQQVAVWRDVQTAVSDVGCIAAEHEVAIDIGRETVQVESQVRGIVAAVKQHDRQTGEIRESGSTVKELDELGAVGAGLVCVNLVDDHRRLDGR